VRKCEANTHPAAGKQAIHLPRKMEIFLPVCGEGLFRSLSGAYPVLIRCVFLVVVFALSPHLNRFSEAAFCSFENGGRRDDEKEIILIFLFNAAAGSEWMEVDVLHPTGGLRGPI
jgi:hypothetical protein